jgi:hypothetical protein
MAPPPRRRGRAAALATLLVAAAAAAVVAPSRALALAHNDDDAAAWSRLLAEHYANSTVAAPHLLDLHAHDALGGLLLPPSSAPAAAAAAGRALLSSGDLPSVRRRALLAASDQWRDTGRYALLRNPEMPGRRSSTGQVAIHSVLIPGTYKILIAGRNLPKNGPKSIPEPQVGGNVSTIYDAKAGTYRVSENYDTLFCTGHTHASDGTIVAAGGDAGRGYEWMKEGRDVVRLFRPGSMRWETLPGVKLSEYRWYPTQVQLPDDRVVIVSGFLDDPGVPTGKPAPSIDVFDYKTLQIVARRSRYDLGKGFFTNVTPGYQLYPTVFLMPWTDPDAPGEFCLELWLCFGGVGGGGLERGGGRLSLFVFLVRGCVNNSRRCTPSRPLATPTPNQPQNNSRLLPVLLHVPHRPDRPPHPSKRVQGAAHLARLARRQHLRRVFRHGLRRDAALQEGPQNRGVQL